MIMGLAAASAWAQLTQYFEYDKEMAVILLALRTGLPYILRLMVAVGPIFLGQTEEPAGKLPGTKSKMKMKKMKNQKKTQNPQKPGKTPQMNLPGTFWKPYGKFEGSF